MKYNMFDLVKLNDKGKRELQHYDPTTNGEEIGIIMSSYPEEGVYLIKFNQIFRPIKDIKLYEDSLELFQKDTRYKIGDEVIIIKSGIKCKILNSEYYGKSFSNPLFKIGVDDEWTLSGITLDMIKRVDDE